MAGRSSGHRHPQYAAEDGQDRPLHNALKKAGCSSVA